MSQTLKGILIMLAGSAASSVPGSTAFAGVDAVGITSAALAAATIVTFSTIHVRESKYATTDAATTFWLTIALWLVLRVIRLGRTRDSLLEDDNEDDSEIQ